TTNNITIADVGSGTGISCALFLRSSELRDTVKAAGKRLVVYGVEPNGAMRKAAEDDFGEFIDRHGSSQELDVEFRSVDGSAEATGLSDGSVDLVVGFQCAHWWDIPAAAAELRRILRQPDSSTTLDGNDNPANVVLAWNSRPETGDGSEGMEKLALEFGEPKAGTSDGDRVDEEVDNMFDRVLRQLRAKGGQVAIDGEVEWVVRTNVYYGELHDSKA
ncbi:hypothetical protein HDU93_003671, partial [Gonapodya sp. JEL0774]